jgi:hypothetical protein
MAGGGTANQQQSVIDGLSKIVASLAPLKLLPDAGQHAAALGGIEQAIIRYIQTFQAKQAAMAAQQGAQMAQQAGSMGGAGGAGGNGGGGGMGGDPSGMPGGAPSPAGGPPGGAPGGGMGAGPPSPGGAPGGPPQPQPQRIAPGGGSGMSGFGGAVTDPDELRRMLLQNSAGG